MNEEFDVENIKKRMNGAVESVKNDFKSLRTGRASSSILDNITVEVYGIVGKIFLIILEKF